MLGSISGKGLALMIQGLDCSSNVSPMDLCSSPSGPANGKYKALEGQLLKDTKWKIPRGDVAHFMLKALQTHNWDKKAVAIASEK